ncbi:MAG: PilT/PilU family type 4a pilus ATPase [Abditibacteriales bacterium]|nr:PilT/PilU family type 4a pilus ATPase [Abditibacteriales bacterium]
MTDYYQLLGLERTATPQDVRAAFERKKAEILQRWGNTPQAQAEGQKLVEAAQTLYDPAKRAAYDRMLQQQAGKDGERVAVAPPPPTAVPHAEPVEGHEPVTLSSGHKYHLDDFLRLLVEKEGSDLHLRIGEPPIFRIHGRLTRQTQFPVLQGDDIQKLMYAVMNEERRRRFEEKMELDMSYYLPGVARFRVNVFRQRFHVGAVLRQIPVRIKTIDEMNFPPIFKDLAMRPRGLFLVTGPTGSGKSTTLASIIDHINTHRRAHIITIEDPIEFVHQDKLCAVEQRELGVDTHSFANALKHVLRQNPDVILVGEMRDLETIALAITAAETGHLVFATLHTTDAAQTVDRIIDVFPPEQQSQIRTQLATTLLCVVSQTLLPLAEGEGRIPAFEIMICTPAIRAIIREAKTPQIYSIVQTSRELGMISLDEYLIGLLRERKVTWEHALAKTSNPADFANRALREGLIPASAAEGIMG